MAGEFEDICLFRGVLCELRVLVVVVDVVADAEELLVCVGASHQHTCDTDDIAVLDDRSVGGLSFENELHLAWLNAVHLGFLKDLILRGI